MKCTLMCISKDSFTPTWDNKANLTCKTDLLSCHPTLTQLTTTHHLRRNTSTHCVTSERDGEGCEEIRMCWADNKVHQGYQILRCEMNLAKCDVL
ncbi:hypothetical protein E2C01_002224 [Portunus trituberculatus]|uniref:Uncharacterized protein n=1 Tax=Portunus trituberculatus TaxID=210409 RepID=A0A5B7CJU3_PORTR|nr:hypothetical protein [Portunus trituberculatus]